jgi:hypothetical protein
MKSDFILMPDKEVDFLVNAFPEVDFSLYQAIVGENAFMSAFSCRVKNEETLERFWNRINNLIGTEYQTKLDDEFSGWNIYLTFFIPEKISNALKYTIENNTFFVRKIVFDSKFIQREKEQAATYLNNHILGKDIIIEPLLFQEVISEPNYSLTTQKLLNAKLPLGRSASDKASRQVWLDKAILEVD